VVSGIESRDDIGPLLHMSREPGIPESEITPRILECRYGMRGTYSCC